MRIAVDAMGGDYGPRVTVEGALNAAHDFGLEVLLVGVRDLIAEEVLRLGKPEAGVTIVDAPEAIGMSEGLLSFRRKKRSSIRIGAQLVKEGRADALVSTGNTAAVVSISQKTLGALRGVDRPALALLVPTQKGLTLLIDVGANANCRPHHLEQFAVMGRIFMENVLGVPQPRIGLMSIGEERTKGNELTKAAFERLDASSLNFIGNVEGKDIYSGKADVIVSDGFTGNVALKVSEGVIENMLIMARSEITRNLLAKVGYFLMRRHLRRLFRKLDYAQYGGAHLLGINGVCIIGHGRSNPTAVRNAVRLAREYVRKGVTEKIRNEIGRMARVTEGIKA
jgi:glycerol-3-phosphate acyltransferase PlsX